MAQRPVFVVTDNNQFYKKELTDFEFHRGFSDSQQRKSIRSLHQAYLAKHPNMKILEISSKSDNPVGVQLSAFNLIVQRKNGLSASVESIFQSSKVFEFGGPYKDLLLQPPNIAKKDPRLKNSGRIVSFHIDGKDFPTEPKTFFYNWIYINALNLNKDVAEQVTEYDAFTDIVFNPHKSINCQAEAAAIYVSLRKQGLLDCALSCANMFKKIVYSTQSIESIVTQESFFL